MSVYDNMMGYAFWTGTKSDNTTDEIIDISSSTASEIQSSYGYTSVAAGWPNNRAEQYKKVRLILLQYSDKLVPTDLPSSLLTPMKTYRQALRDLPDHANWPNLNDDDWPVMPNFDSI